MKRRVLVLGLAAAVVVLAAWAAQQRPDTKSNPPELVRALKAKGEAPPVAVLIEMGLKDEKPANWSGKAVVKGATVVRRKGYRFRKDGKNDDKLVAKNAWQLSSHYSVRAPRGNPIRRRMEPVATVGVIHYLKDVQNDATMIVQVPSIKSPQAKVDLNKILAGEPVSIFGGYAVVRRISSATPVVMGGKEDDHPAAAYGPDGTLWMAYISYALRDEKRRIEQPRYPRQPKDFQHLYKPDYAEQLILRPYRNGKWGKPIKLTDDQQDIARCAVTVTDDNSVWVVYSAHRGNNFDIYARRLDNRKGMAIIGKELRVTTNPGPDLTPVACVGSDGIIWVACQSWNNTGVALINVFAGQFEQWSIKATFHNGDANNNWHPSLAAGPNGQIAFACDFYNGESYDVDAGIFTRGKKQKIAKNFQSNFIANGPKFQARPSVTFDTEGNLWVAYEVGPEKWGKDYGAQDSKDGNPLYNTRTVEVVCRKPDGSWHKPVAQLPGLTVSAPQLPFDAFKTNRFEKRTRLAYPKIGIDGKGRPWLTYRKNFGSRYTSHPGATWRTYARRLDGAAWTPEMEVHHSDGLLDNRPVLLPHHSGGLAIIHNTDGRFTTPNTINNRIYMSLVDVQRKHESPKTKVIKLARRDPSPGAKQEQETVQRIRDFRINHKGKMLRLLRGEYHRHTEISWDGAPDGSLEDMFRYAIDAAAFDWIGNGDHDNGAGREYPWYQTQKFNDAYYIPGQFTPMHTYERSVSYPHGHRNVMFAQRGVMTLPRLAAGPNVKKVAGIHPDDTKMLYRYLREFDGICAVHTSATGMGTDWRDNDPKVEPIVEIYQGDRMSYETEGAPRAGYDPKKPKQLPANVGGWRPLGFVDLALRDKGYKLAFQASSDHWSTHISYFIVLAEKNDRKSILEAVKQRHCYGATDNIIVDLRSGEHIQGDEFSTRAAPSLQFNVIGTGAIAKIDVMKNSRVVKTFRPKASEFKGQWTDPAPNNASNYYYIRVLQTDGEVAWASPMWIRRTVN